MIFPLLKESPPRDYDKICERIPGIAAARQMLERIQFPNSPHSYAEYETKLIIRDSTL